MRRMRKDLDNWKNNHTTYVRTYSKKVAKNREKKMKMLMYIFKTFKRRFGNTRQLLTVQRGKSQTPRHILLLTRTERNKIIRLLNRDFRKR